MCCSRPVYNYVLRYHIFLTFDAEAEAWSNFNNNHDCKFCKFLAKFSKRMQKKLTPTFTSGLH